MIKVILGGFLVVLIVLVVVVVFTNLLNPYIYPQSYPKQRPYQIKEVSFTGGEKNVTIVGEITIPYGDENYPAIVMLTGSGELDRNEEIFGHKPFLVISDYLTKHGYVVLRCDDRGVGKSTGDFSSATTQDFANDGVAAMRWLKKQKNIDIKKMGYLGHSEGGIKAPLASLQEKADFLILLAGPVIPHQRTAVEQQLDFAKAEGKSKDEINRVRKAMAKIVHIAQTNLAHNEIKNKITAIIKKEKEVLPLWMPHLFDAISIKWLQWLLHYDPLPALKAFDKPILALYGANDTQVSAIENAPVIKNTFVHKDSKVIIFDKLNHFFQPAKKGTVEEIPWIDITFDEKVLKSIVDWLNETIKGKR